MFVQDIYIKRAEWMVRVYHAVDAMWTDEIIDDLVCLGCSGSELRNAKKMLWSGLPNNGLTYSNGVRRETLMVIGYTSSGKEYWNTLDHEKNHLLQHIALQDGIDPYGEEISYISGEFLRDIYDGEAKKLLCDCCREKIVR